MNKPEIEGMVWVAPGAFQIGSPDNEIGRFTDETPHNVILTKGFYISKYQVTQEQYTAVMGSNPGNFYSNPAVGEVQGRRPVETVSWYDALVFCNRLSIAEGLNPVYSIDGKTDPAELGSVPSSDDAAWNAAIMDGGANGYRLPVEAEWEYACRAGTTTAYNTGAVINDDTGWYYSNSDNRTHEAGRKSANAWGLYDMHGNVWEWCWDWYEDFSSADVTDPKGAAAGDKRAVRGGSFDSDGLYLRSAYRGSGSPSNRSIYLGFRVVRNEL